MTYYPNNQSSWKSLQQKKGEEFEQFVVSRFNPEYFTLLEWQGDKHYKGIYPLSNQRPDLVYKFSSGRTKKFFAVECKWRARDYFNRFEWAKDSQVKNYEEFLAKTRMSLFILFGLGGKPQNPQHVYVVPFLEICDKKRLDLRQLENYHRTAVRHKFFIDFNNMILK